MATRKTAAKRSSSPQKKGKAKAGKVMHEFKHGELKSGSGGKVKNPKQAIAIGLSEARRAGADIPKKKSAATKNKAATKKAATKKKTGTAKKSRRS